MAQDAVSRRGFAALVAGALAWPSLGRPMELNRSAVASRLPARDGPYVPPTNISAVYDLYHRMTAPVRVNGQGPFPFVVDTGSNQTVISAELAAKLGLVLGEPAEVNGVAGVQIAPRTIARLDVGARRQADAALSVLPEASIGGPGLLGLDDLEGQAVTLDFRGRALRVEPGRRLPVDPDAVVMPAHRRSGQMTLMDAELNGLRLTAFLDSGSDNTIGNLALHRLAVARSPNLIWLKAPILSATGQTIEAEIASLSRLRIAGLTIASWPVAFADLHTFQMWDLINKPAILIGVDLLSRFEYVCLDFARDEVRFRLPESA